MAPRHTDFKTLIAFAAPDECWEWVGSKTARGYGRLGPRWAHRISYEHYNGPIPKDLVVRHKCDNPGCVNPNHLETGTQLENVADAMERQVRPFQTKPFERLTFVIIAAIRDNPHGLTDRQLCFKHTVHIDTLRKIRAHYARDGANSEAT